MTTTTPSAPSAAPSTGGGRGDFMNFAKATGVVAGALGAGALILNNGANALGDTVGGISDASNIKVVASSVLLAGAGMLGLAVEKDGMGREIAPTAVGVGSAAVAGYAIGNMFTGGYLEKGSVGMGLAGAAIATGYSVFNRVKSRGSRTRTPRTGGRVSGLWNRVKDGYENLSDRRKSVAKGLGAGALALGVTEASITLNWPFGGFNHTGAVLSAAAVSTGVVFGGKIKEKIEDLNHDHPVATKIGLVTLGLVTLGAGAYAWKHGIIGGHNKSGASEHTPKGNGSSTTVTTAVPTTNGNSSTTVATTVPTTNGNTSTTVATTVAPAPPAVPVPAPNGGGSQFTLQTFSAANKPGMVAKITGLQPGINPAKANSIADQILAGQYEGVAKHGDKFAEFVAKVSQPQADAMFQYDVTVLAAA